MYRLLRRRIITDMTDQNPLKPAILVISDTASADPSADATGPVLVDAFSNAGSHIWDKPVISIVPDSISAIQDQIRLWTGEHHYQDPGSTETINLIVTTGGTGFAVRDRTPEVGLLSQMIAVHWWFLSVADLGMG